MNKRIAKKHWSRACAPNRHHASALRFAHRLARTMNLSEVDAWLRGVITLAGPFARYMRREKRPHEWVLPLVPRIGGRAAMYYAELLDDDVSPRLAKEIVFGRGLPHG